jgi:Zn-dependent protease
MGSIIVPALLVLSNAGILFGWAKPVPYNPYNLKNQRWGEALVGCAGVATNILLAILFAIIARLALADGATLFATLASEVVFVNLSLGLFNLIPIPPLDGFTVLRGILPARFGLSFREIENRFFGNNILTRFVIVFIFAYFFATPFYILIQWLFRMLVGVN